MLHATFNMGKWRICWLSRLLAICSVLPILSLHYSKKLLPFFPLASPMHQAPNTQRHQHRAKNPLAAMAFAE